MFVVMWAYEVGWQMAQNPFQLESLLRHSSLLHLTRLRSFGICYKMSIYRKTTICFLYLNVRIFSTLLTLIPKNRRKFNVAILMTMTMFLLIFTFSFIFLYLFSIPLGIFLCFFSVIYHPHFSSIFSPQFSLCRN